MTTMDQTNGNVIASLINVSKAIEDEIDRATSEGGLTLFSAKHRQVKTNEEGETVYSFSDIKLPEILSNDLFGWVIIISTKGQYIAALNLINKETNETYLSYEVQVGQESWEKLKKLFAA